MIDKNKLLLVLMADLMLCLAISFVLLFSLLAPTKPHINNQNLHKETSMFPLEQSLDLTQHKKYWVFDKKTPIQTKATVVLKRIKTNQVQLKKKDKKLRDLNKRLDKLQEQLKRFLYRNRHYYRKCYRYKDKKVCRWKRRR